MLKISKEDLNKLIEVEKTTKYFNDNKEKFGSNMKLWVDIDNEIYHGDYVGLYLHDACEELGYENLTYDDLLDIRDAVVKGMIADLK